jgi:hypothetical protein
VSNEITPDNSGYEKLTLDSSLFSFNWPNPLDHIGPVETQEFLKMTFVSYTRLGTLQLDNHKQCVLAYYSNGPMYALYRTTHDVQTRKYLNKFGLKIFLTEPLCSHIVDDPYGHPMFHNFNFGFYSEFFNDNEANRKFRAKELDSIFDYVRRNALTNVTVATCDYRVKECYPLYSNYMELTYEDLFIKDMRIYDNVDKKLKTEIKKKFICPTWRYTTARWALSALLQDMDCYLSWYFAVPINLIDQYSPWINRKECEKHWPGFYERLEEAGVRLNRKAPYCLDIKSENATFVGEHAAHNYPDKTINDKLNDGMNPVAVNELFQPLNEIYNHTFLSIQIESRFAQPTGNWSEKVIQAIQYKTPFIIVAPPYTLQCMQEAGYKTFSKWWDESYDTEENHLLRLKKIVTILDWIETLTYDELQEMYNEMIPIVEYNFIKSITNSQTGTMQPAHDPETAVHLSWDSEWCKTEFNQDGTEKKNNS